MKRIIGKLKQALSIVLAAAMIVTCLPQTGIPVIAAQDTGVEGSDEPDVSIETAENEKNDSNESAPAGDEADGPEETDTEENGIMTLSLNIRVEKAEDAENYSVIEGEYTAGKQYFTVTADLGYMISPEEGAVTATKNGQAVTVKEGNGEDEYYVEVDETDGEVEIVVTVKVVETVTVTIKIADAADTDGLVKNIMCTTAAAPGDADWKKLETEGAPNLMETFKSGDDFKIKFELKENYKAEVKAGKLGEEKAITPEDGVYTVKNITADTNVIIAAAPIEYTINTVITVDGKNVTAAEIEEIKEEIKEAKEGDILVTGYEQIKSLQKGDALEFSLAACDSVYYIKSVQCKVGSASEKMEITYSEDSNPEYGLTASRIAEVFPNLQDGDTITVEINMEKAWKVTFHLEGVTVQDARSINADGWVEIIDKETCYVKKGASLALTAEKNAGSDVPIQEAWYQTGTQKTDIKDKINGKKFPIPISGDTIVTIKSIAEKSYNLAFNNEDSEIITVSEKKLGNDPISYDNITIKEGEVTSKNKITFKAAAQNGYKPVVTVEERRNSGGSDKWVRVKTLTPTKAGVYELTSLAAESRITIDKALDETACNVLNISPEKGTNPNAYTAMLTVSGNEPKELGSKDTYLAPLEKAEAVLTINLEDGYEKAEVTINGEKKAPDVTGNDPAGYKITFTETKTIQNITVSAVEEAAKADTIVRFSNTAPHMSYKVTTVKNGPVTQVTDGNVSNTYKISKDKDGRSIQFTVTAANAYYKPEVKINNADGKDAIAPISVDTKKRIYTYNIAVKNIDDGKAEENGKISGTIYIQETSESRSVSVDYNKDEAEVSADVGGGIQNPEEGVYSVTDGDTINFKVSVKDNCKLLNIIAKNLTTGKETKVAKNSISVKADADYEVTVNTQALTAIKVYEAETKGTDDEKLVPLNKNKTYSVQGGTGYVIEVKNGTKKAELKFPRFAYETNSEAKVNDDGTVTVKMNRADADVKKATQLALTLKDADKNAYTVTLELAPLAGVKKVDGVKVVKKENILTQTVNTTKSYAITMNPATAAVTLDAYVVEENAGVTAEVKGKTLVITTAIDSKVDNLATVVLFDKTAEPGENGKKPDLYRFKVSTALPALPTPTVALQSADDTTLTLTLGAKNLALPDAGKVYYKVEVTPDTKATNSLKKEQQDKVKSVTEYFEVEGKDGKANPSQTEKVGVINANRGEGFANTFDVKVTLVQSKKGLEIGKVTGEDGKETTNEEANALTSSKSAAKKRLKTKAPAYATKITFKKGASAVYTNQSNVLAATAVFDKNATYTTLIDENSDTGAPKDISYSGDEALDISIDGSQILVSATSETAIGKHVIRVTASNGERGADKMRQTTADYTVTVERAIEKIELIPPSFFNYDGEKIGMIYKAAGKAASFTVGIRYNEGKEQPKTKKVNWTITDEEGNALKDARGVTVKNGKVTIPKDYILTKSGDEDKTLKIDYVYVTATAADVKADPEGGQDPVKETVGIRIYNRTESIGETILVKEDPAERGKYEVIARSGGAVTAKQLKGADIVVLKKGAVDKDRYDFNELFGEAAVEVPLTYKASNRAIVVNEKGVVEEVNSGGLTKVTITAAAADGSNLKSELKNLKVNYHEPKEYGLAVRQMTPWESENVEVLYKKNNSTDYIEYEFYGALDTIFQFQVKERQDGEWTELSAVSNYALAVTGASILDKNVVNGTYTIICNKADITVKLTDKKTNNVTTYKFSNKAVSTAKAPTLKAETKGDLIAGKYNGGQQIRYKLSGFKGDNRNSFVLITLDAKDSTNKKNEARYKEFEKYCRFLNNASYTVEQLEELGLVFGNGYTDIPAGTYKLTVNFGKINNDFLFEATTKPVSLTVKASAPKISTKLNSDYTLSVNNAAAGTELKLNNDKAVLKSVELVNDNVNGKENDFTKYFEIKEKGGTFVLKFNDKSDLSEKDLIYIKDKNKAKNDLTGWVTYTYDNGISGTETAQAQIRVKGYAEPTYTMDSGKALKNENMTIKLAVRTGNHTVGVAHAYSTTDALKVTGVGTAVEFKVTGAVSGKDVYIVPTTSACTKVLDELKEEIVEAGDDTTKRENAEKKYAEAVKAFGAKVTAKVTVVDKLPANNPFMKFRYDTAWFNKYSYWVDDWTGPGHTPDYKGRYEVVFPFTKNITEAEAPKVKITEIIASGYPLETDSGLLEAGIDYYDQSLLYIDCVKEKLAELAAKGEVFYGEPLMGTILIEHQNGQAESFDFTVYLPQSPAMTAEKQIDTVSGNAAPLKDEVIVLKDWQAGAIKEYGGTPDSADLKRLRQTLYSDNVEKLDEIIIKQNSEWDSGIWFRLPHWVEESEWNTFVEASFSDDEGLVTLPTSEKEGSIRYTITWENTEKDPESGERTRSFVVERRIAKLPATPEELKDALKEAIEAAQNSLTLTDKNRWEFEDLLEAEIIKVLLENAETKEERKHLRVRVGGTDVTPGDQPKITYGVVLRDIKYGEEKVVSEAEFDLYEGAYGDFRIYCKDIESWVSYTQAAYVEGVRPAWMQSDELSAEKMNEYITGEWHGLAGYLGALIESYHSGAIRDESQRRLIEEHLGRFIEDYQKKPAGEEWYPDWPTDIEVNSEITEIIAGTTEAAGTVTGNINLKLITKEGEKPASASIPFKFFIPRQYTAAEWAEVLPNQKALEYLTGDADNPDHVAQWEKTFVSWPKSIVGMYKYKDGEGNYVNDFSVEMEGEIRITEKPAKNKEGSATATLKVTNNSNTSDTASKDVTYKIKYAASI